ncbi:MAG: hypothetical protein L3J35_09845 [Bacteroidales bacterium]|nr:hypothetical protein [Bacteroidales bacterium]
MKLLSIIILASLSFSGSLCFDKFEIVETTSQEWSGGTRNSGYGTHYEINIVPKVNSTVLIFDQAWIGDKYFEISTFQKGKKIRNNLFGKGDTITIRINDAFSPKFHDINKDEQLKEKKLIEKHELPYKYKGKALLSYTYNGKRKYKEIKEFTKLEPLQYP